MYKKIKSEINVIAQSFCNQKKYAKVEKGPLVKEIASSIVENSIVINANKIKINCRSVYQSGDLKTDIYLKFLSNYLKRNSDNLFCDRRTAIQLIQNEALSKSYNYIVKLDIKNYYNSIDVLALKELIYEKEEIYQIEYLNVLNQYLKVAEKNNSVMPGLSPSNILAEIYAKELDRQIKELLLSEGIKFSYTRYVDDIFIYTNNEVKLEKFISVLSENQLCLNEEKSKVYNINKNVSIDYLGYEFNFKDREMEAISISNDKLDPVLNKLDSLLKEYEKKKCASISYSKIELDQWFYQIYKHLFYTRVYKKNNSIIYTGFAHSYTELYNKFGIPVKKEGNMSSVDKKINSKLSNLKNQQHHFFTKNRHCDHMLTNKIIFDNKKIIFIDSLTYFNKEKIIKFLELHYKIYNKPSIKFKSLSYYEITSLYHEEIKKVLNN